MANATGSGPKIFYGWIVTGVICTTLAMAYGAQYSFGVFLPSIIEELQWNRQSVAGAFSLYTLVYSALGVLMGKLADRFGPRNLLMAGSICLGIGIALTGRIVALWQLYVVYGLIAALGMSAAYITGVPTVVKWFVRKRGLALGLAQSGLGAGIMVVPLFSGWLISVFGWRTACLILGSMVFLVLFALSFFLVGHPEKMGLRPDGCSPQKAEEDSARGPEIYFTEACWSVSEALRTGSFWVLTAIFFLTWIFVFVPLVHLVAFALDMGIPRESALLAWSCWGAALMVGRLLMGYISDVIGRKRTLLMNLALNALAWVWIMETTNAWMLILFATVFGFSHGGVSLVFPAITGDYFGRLKAASVIGMIFTIAGSSAAIGPVVAGYVHDVTHSYRLIFFLGALTNALAFVLTFLSKPPRRKNFTPERGES
jgi:OFA family oxalate/formate antiporter-like MFS transporter